MEYRVALGITMTLLCFDTWADSQSDGGLEGILDRIEYRGVVTEKAAPISPPRVKPASLPLGKRATAAAVAPHSRLPGAKSVPDAAPQAVTGTGAQPRVAPATPSGVWGATERAPSIPELDE